MASLQSSILPMTAQAAARKRYAKLFQCYDRRGDGTISKEVLGHLLHDLRAGRVEDMVAMLCTIDSINNDGWIAYDQCLAFLLDTCLGHTMRAPSVQHLVTDVMQAVRGAGCDRNSKIFEIEPEIIRATTRTLQCPRDKRLGTAYVDSIYGEERAGIAHVMLSYTWGYAVGDVVESVEAYCENKGLATESSYVWICCLCINQHRVREAAENGERISFAKFQEEFSSRVAGIGHILVMQSTWHAPLNLKRLWCIFEIYKAIHLERCEFEVIMPPAETESLMNEIIGAGNLDTLWEAITTIDVSTAEATVKADKEHILLSIGKNTTYGAVSEEVQQRLKECFASSLESRAQSEIELCEAAAGGSLPASAISAAKVCNAAAEIFSKLEKARQALDLLEKGLSILKLAGVMESDTGAMLQQRRGMVRFRCSDPDGARCDFEEAYRIRVASDSVMTLHGADLLRCLGSSYRGRKDFQKALQTYQQALTIYEEFDALETSDGASLLNSIGSLKTLTDDAEGALLTFNRARCIRENTGTLLTPQGAKLLISMGEAEEQLGHIAAAVLAYEDAKAVISKLAMLDNSIGKEVQEHLDSVTTTYELDLSPKSSYGRHRISLSMEPPRPRSNLLKTAVRIRLALSRLSRSSAQH